MLKIQKEKQQWFGHKVNFWIKFGVKPLDGFRETCLTDE